MSLDAAKVVVPNTPRVVQVCTCGAVLRRMTKQGGRSFYFWWKGGRMDPRKSFRLEATAGFHCAAEFHAAREAYWQFVRCVGMGGWHGHYWFKPLGGGRIECSTCGARPGRAA